MTDKETVHGYDRFYKRTVAWLLGLPTTRPPAMIEIGVEQGKSIPFWRQLAPSWKYIGLDLSVIPSSDPFVDVQQLDQSDPGALDAFVANERTLGLHSFMLIVDDGSHVPDHQVLSFNKLFPLLDDGGFYVVEDVETSYWSRGTLYEKYVIRCGFRNPGSIVERFKQAADVVNLTFLHEDNRRELDRVCCACGFDAQVLPSIRTITFGPNFVLIEKKVTQDREFEKPYRLSGFL